MRGKKHFEKTGFKELYCKNSYFFSGNNYLKTKY